MDEWMFHKGSKHPCMHGVAKFEASKVLSKSKRQSGQQFQRARRPAKSKGIGQQNQKAQQPA